MKKGMFSRYLSLFVALACTLNIQAQDNKVTPETVSTMSGLVEHQAMSINDFLLNSNQFSTFVKALKLTNSLYILDSSNNFTVFAPTNDAFAKLPSEVISQLFSPDNIAKLKSIVDYHIVKGANNLKQQLQDTNNNKHLLALNYNVVNVSLGSEEVLYITDANGFTIQVLNEIELSNGIVYTIDTVLFPQVDVKVVTN